MTIPNLITTIRIILAPIFIIYLINDQYFSALIVFMLCCLSDGLDGLLARLFNQKSRIGTYLDPIADKLLLVATFITLAIRGSLPSWLTVTVIARDVLILLGVAVLFFVHTGFVKIKPSFLSKLTTCLQFASVMAVLSRGNLLTLPPVFYRYLFYLTALFTISSGLHYMHYWFKMMGEGPEEKGE
ncbi:MAG: CDP-alcohol phosphatidyltransferase family protein [Deltaproteobacteria bacterium]|nr:CDP-alcohol phosphatidyltransferase family protein [Deltaproteobacteria bacterium]MBW2016577.1 CDP-alcohol phosphatidyltransferase family protein [Deltaproteobacteria bacterium]MBW2129517.1 CDP-alcohol phosphatidyltransferase family protein [Deltaproteobacteria bacterium]MBW2304713.1 CDP-alcohol phosphatidyltransferase family protein [Deltaproteobacteria bacterium]